MEFRAPDVAQLVLGYLKDTKCKRAFLEFLNSCVHLKDHAASYRRRQYFVTRVAGLSLVDYLEEYAIIYTIVQERLEASEYFKENQCRTSLVKQLLYLLDKLEVQSRASTPVNQENDVNRNFIQDDINASINSNCEIENVPENSSFDRLPNALNSTPSHQISNTSVKESNSLNKSKNKVVTPTADKSTATDEDFDAKEKSHEKCEEIFTNTFLENVELIEKLADNINKEVSSKSKTELDSMAIESIVQRTETDPIFVQLINELIDAPNEEKTNDVDHDGSALQKSNTSDRSKDGSFSKKNTTPNEASIKRRLRSTKPQAASQTKVNTIDDQNDDAVKSICMHASLSDAQQLSSNSNFSSKNAAVISTELLLSTEQNINITQSLYTNPSSQNTVFTNTGNLLMLQPSASIANPSIIPQKTLTLDTSKSCYLIGNQPFVVPPAPIKIPTALSEQDILTMPTIFVCDPNQQLTNTQTVVVPTSANVIGPPRYQNIAPKQTPDKAQSLSEYITLYKCNDTTSSPHISSPVKTAVIQPKQTSLNRSLLQIIPESTISLEPEKVKSNENNSETISKKSSSQNEIVGLPLISPTELESEGSQLKVAEKKEKGNRTTPKGSSHIRQLDFSTPDKWFSTSSTKTKNPTNAKNIRTSLFKSPNEEETVVEEEKNGPQKTLGLKSSVKSEAPKTKTLEPSWDASLRVFQVSKPPEIPKPRKKRKRIGDAAKQVSSTKKLKESSSKPVEEVDNNNPPLKDEESVSESLPSVNTNNKKNKGVDKRTEKTPKKKSDLEKKTKKKAVEVVNEEDTGSTKVNSATEDAVDSSKNEENEEKSFRVINRNMNSKIKRKCNIDNSKKLFSNDEVVLTNVPKIKSLEVLDDSKNTLILSPSKLNANKRSLVEMANVIEQNIMKSSIDLKNSAHTENKKDSLSEEFADPPPKMNSLPLLQTPVKVDIMHIPKTPGINTSVAIDTPFTKAVIDQLSGVDINSIPTPKFPITPNFALTPAFAHSPFSNRGTDYSTSSSYYQPSDTEQNKSLEQLIQECQRLEKQETNSNNKEDVDKKNSVENEKIDETHHSNTSLETVLQASSTNKDDEMKEKIEVTLNESEEIIQKLIAEKQKAFNESLSGKKNMHLAKLLSDADPHNSDSDSVSTKDGSSSSDDDSSSTSSECSCNVTPVKNNTANPYSLRPRKTPSRNYSKDGKIDLHSVSPELKKIEKPLITHQTDVLQKMEAIRQRTIDKIKIEESTKPKSGTLVRSLPRLRKGVSRVPTEKVKTVEKSNDENKNTSEEKIDKQITPKKLETSIDAVAELKSSAKKPKNKTPSSKEKLKAENKKETDKINNSVKNAKCSKGIVDSKGTAEDKTLSTPSAQLLKKETTSTTVEEVDIVLHLSSDDENLEPFEMVETELLECSVSSTPLSESQKEEKSANSDNKKEDLNEKNLDNEAESLVKGLKQWGIHLVPNKSAKKTTADRKDVKDTKLDENKSASQKKSTSKEEKTDIERTDVKDNKVVVEAAKKESPSPRINKKSSEGEAKDSKVVSHADKKTTSRSKTEKKGPSVKTTKDDKTDKSQVKSKSKVQASEVKKPSKSSSVVKEKQVGKRNERKASIEERKRRLSFEKEKLVGKEINFQVQFDTKTFEEETIKIEYDYNSTPTKKMSDYDLDILTKTFAADVYIQEINSEVEKFMSFSRFKFLLDISPKSSHKKGEKLKSNSTELSHSLLKKRKPLDILYNQMVSEPGSVQTSSPLENVYALDMSTKERFTTRRLSNKSEKVEIQTSSPLENIYALDMSTREKFTTRRSSSKSEKLETNGKSKSSVSVEKRRGSKEEKTETNSMDKVKKPDVQKDECLESNLRIDKDIESAKEEGVVDSENDLMNYAIIGSERIENNDEVEISSPDKRKRKPSDDISIEKREEKKKKTEECQELLRSIDVDSFLKQLHGDM